MENKYKIGDRVVVVNLIDTGIADYRLEIGSTGKVEDITKYGNYIVDIDSERWCLSDDNLITPPLF